MAREAEALSFIDAVHFAPHELVDVKEWGCDFLACSAYKFHGPHLGVLYGRREQLEALDVPKLEPAPEATPERIETGTQNHEGIVGAAAAVEYLASLARADDGNGTRRPPRAAAGRVRSASISEGQCLLKQLWDGLSELEGVKLFGPPPSAPRTPTLAFTIRGKPAVGGQPAAGRSRHLCVSRRLLRDDRRSTAGRGRFGIRSDRLRVLHDER